MINDLWDDLYRHWRTAWVITEGGLDGAHPRLVDVAIPRPARDTTTLAAPVIDWWPTADLAARGAALQEFGAGGATWPHRPGIGRTAGLLHEHAMDDEGLAAVWIAAFARDQTPIAGPLGLTTTLDAVFVAAGHALRQRDRVLWHHATRLTLPATVMTPALSAVLAGQGPGLIVEFARLSALATMAHWTLVRVTRGPVEVPNVAALRSPHPRSSPSS